ncbi:MAG TPA: hypothetical protein VFH56_02300, partial [Acidimicrobiales bacterium]|nr:hypothetical protein [Acidimicrobiales bacterium]
MAFVNSDGTNPVIDLGGGSGGSFDLSGLPTGPTGPAAQPATNYLSMSSSKFTAQGPQLFVGWTKAKKVPAQATRGGYRGDFADEAHGVRTPI